uniref:Protein kinase domain-containing protein n=1 Tax=Physcomitrium patens TaxID=3218 RepID=A0A2K1L3J5_PHYPA|nr:hypothetical protein PHYPA_003393 [Physcomitrium patens]
MFEEKVFDTIHIATYDEVEADERYLYERLILSNEEENFENFRLIMHLLLRMKHFYGSTTYMAPKVLKNKSEIMTMCSFDVDVFSLTIVSCKTLSKRDSFDDCKRIEILERIERGERLELPMNYDELAELIKDYWNLNPLHRPKFANICERFVILKKKIIDGVVAKTPYYGTSKDNIH